jgi:hypothetical protein
MLCSLWQAGDGFDMGLLSGFAEPAAASPSRNYYAFRLERAKRMIATQGAARAKALHLSVADRRSAARHMKLRYKAPPRRSVEAAIAKERNVAAKAKAANEIVIIRHSGSIDNAVDRNSLARARRRVPIADDRLTLKAVSKGCGRGRRYGPRYGRCPITRTTSADNRC